MINSRPCLPPPKQQNLLICFFLRCSPPPIQKRPYKFHGCEMGFHVLLAIGIWVPTILTQWRKCDGHLIKLTGAHFLSYHHHRRFVCLSPTFWVQRKSILFSFEGGGVGEKVGSQTPREPYCIADVLTLLSHSSAVYISFLLLSFFFFALLDRIIT